MVEFLVMDNKGFQHMAYVFVMDWLIELVYCWDQIIGFGFRIVVQGQLENGLKKLCDSWWNDRLSTTLLVVSAKPVIPPNLYSFMNNKAWGPQVKHHPVSIYYTRLKAII